MPVSLSLSLSLCPCPCAAGGAAGRGPTHLHEDEERGEEEQRGPLHLVQDALQVGDVRDDQQQHGAQHRDPACKYPGNILCRDIADFRQKTILTIFLFCF